MSSDEVGMYQTTSSSGQGICRCTVNTYCGYNRCHFFSVEEHYLDKRKISGSGDNFFNSVESGVAQIVRKDKLQEEYQKVSSMLIFVAEPSL